jgi:hypothetical protein
MAERYTLEDTGEVVIWDALLPSRTYFEVAPMIAMNDPEPQPKRRYFAEWGPALRAAVTHCQSEPWRCHAQVWVYSRTHEPGLRWYVRDRRTNDPDRPVVLEEERMPVERRTYQVGAAHPSLPWPQTGHVPAELNEAAR